MHVVFRIFGLIAASLPAFSQSGNAILSGLVTDPSGAAVPDAVVLATNNLTGVSIETKSNGAGVYLFPVLQPGSYDVTARHQGFRQFVARSVMLEVGAQTTANIVF